MAKKLIKLGYSYIGTTYDDYFVYDIYQNESGDIKYVAIQER